MYENLDTIPTTLINPNKILGKLYFDLDLIGFTLHCFEISGCHKQSLARKVERQRTRNEGVKLRKNARNPKNLPCNSNKWKPLPFPYRAGHTRENSRSVISVVSIIMGLAMRCNVAIA